MDVITSPLQHTNVTIKQRNIENLIAQLKLNEQIIEQVTELNFLGLTIDQHLTWNEYLQKYQTRYQNHSGLCAN